MDAVLYTSPIVVYIYMDVDVSTYMRVSKNRGTPKWMVYNGSNPIEMDDLGYCTPIFGSTPI